MTLDWILHPLRSGNCVVYCKTCETECELNSTGRVYECECEFGATVEALAMGLEGYCWHAVYPENSQIESNRQTGRVFGLLRRLYHVVT